MSPAHAHSIESEVLDDLVALRASTRRDLRPTSLPLLVFGALLLIAAALPSATVDLPWSAYWLVAGPAAFALISWRYRRIEGRLGLGDLSRHYAVGAIGTVVAIAMIVSVLFFVSPLAGAGVALIAVARATRDGWVGVAGGALLVLAILEPWYILSNRVWEVAQVFGSPGGDEAFFLYERNLVMAILAIAVLAAGVIARRRGR